MSELTTEAALLLRALLDRLDTAGGGERAEPCPTCGRSEATLADRARDVLRSVRMLLESPAAQGEPQGDGQRASAQQQPSTRAQRVTIQ